MLTFKKKRFVLRRGKILTSTFNNDFLNLFVCWISSMEATSYNYLCLPKPLVPNSIWQHIRMLCIKSSNEILPLILRTIIPHNTNLCENKTNTNNTFCIPDYSYNLTRLQFCYLFASTVTWLFTTKKFTKCQPTTDRDIEYFNFENSITLPMWLSQKQQSFPQYNKRCNAPT